MKKAPRGFETRTPSLYDQVYEECTAMAKYALGRGKKLPPGTVENIQSCSDAPSAGGMKNLVRIHETLARVITPANPQAILFLEKEAEKQSLLNFLGPIPLVRRMMITAIVCLLLFIFFQAFNRADLSLSILNQSGRTFLLLIATLLAASGLGASFSSLFQANRFVTSGTYDPKYEASYWIRFILGIISGLTLSLLIPMNGMEDSIVRTASGAASAVASGTSVPPTAPIDHDAANAVTDKATELAQIMKPLLAMLGGFSANLVYRILTRLTETVESLFLGSRQEALDGKEKEMKMRMAEEDFRTRRNVASGLLDILQGIAPDTDPNLIKDKLNTLMKKVTAETGEAMETPPEDTGIEAVESRDESSEKVLADKA